MADSLIPVVRNMPFGKPPSLAFRSRWLKVSSYLPYLLLASLFSLSAPVHAEGAGSVSGATGATGAVGATGATGAANTETIKKPANLGASLPDPTRPPASLAQDAPKDAQATAEKIGANGLQTVILRKGKKPVAVINGESVELGGKLGDARLVKLSENEAVLQSENGKEVFHLTPGVERKNVVPPVAKTRAKAKPPKKYKKTKSQPTNK